MPTRTYIVNTFEDLYDNAPNDICAGWVGPGPADFGKCSLRAAITEAGYTHGVPAFVHIKLPPGTYQLTKSASPYAGAEDMHYGDLDFPDFPAGQTPNEVLIEGTGGLGNPSVIDANFIDRVLELGQYRKLTLKNLVLKNGLINIETSVIAGGGGIVLRYKSTLIMENLRLTNNAAACKAASPCTSARGGAIYSENANLRMLNGELDGNSATNGSAIYFWDGGSTPGPHSYEFKVENTAIHNNTSEYRTIESKGRLFLTNSTLADNHLTSVYGAALSNLGEAWVQNSTLTVGVKQFGIYNIGKLYIRNSLLHSAESSATAA